MVCDKQEQGTGATEGNLRGGEGKINSCPAEGAEGCGWSWHSYTFLPQPHCGNVIEVKVGHPLWIFTHM